MYFLSNVLNGKKKKKKPGKFLSIEYSQTR